VADLSNFDPTTRTLTGGTFVIDAAYLAFGGADVVHNRSSITIKDGGGLKDETSADGLRNFNDNLADGEFVIQTVFQASGDFTNAGRIFLGGGFVLPAGSKYTQTGGSTLVGGNFSADRIDILVDLAGHTSDNRLPVFAMKPAPLQITYLGYPNTTGVSAIDYRISDAFADPPGLTEAFHSETLLRLSPCAWCYRPPADVPYVTPLPARTPGKVTFGSFSGFYKIGQDTVDLWSRLLHVLPAARLLLKSNTLRVPVEVKARFHKRGIAPERIELLPAQPTIAQHLAAYARVDIALDPFPYHGTTTTCEAMLMGVPVITCAGKTHVSRVGVSLLSNAGLAHLIAADPEQFVRIGVDLASDLPRLEKLRQTLRQRLLQSPICDGVGFTRGFERALRDVWRRWCNGDRA
jgi:predicted O-linked N-acetylglucosamine transferase (SPINDLY family)